MTNGFLSYTTDTGGTETCFLTGSEVRRTPSTSYVPVRCFEGRGISLSCPVTICVRPQALPFPLVRTKLWISIGHSFGSVWQSRALRSHMTVSGLNAGGINLLPKRYTDVATDLFYVRANCTREEMFIFNCDICREFSGMPLFVTVHLIDLI